MTCRRGEVAVRVYDPLSPYVVDERGFVACADSLLKSTALIPHVPSPSEEGLRALAVLFDVATGKSTLWL